MPIRNNGKRYEIVYEGKVYQNAAFLCREYNISKLLVYGQQRYKPEYSFIECFRLVKQLRDECGWPNTEVFAFIPRCKIQGKFYKRISDFASAVGMTRGHQFVTKLQFQFGRRRKIDTASANTSYRTTEISLQVQIAQLLVYHIFLSQ